MKSINARSTLVAVCICLLAGFTTTRLHAGEYFIYQDAFWLTTVALLWISMTKGMAPRSAA